MSDVAVAAGPIRNDRLADIYIRTTQQPWIPFSPGIDFKLLRATQETGHWSVLFKCEAGSSFARHEHFGAGEYYMISGRMRIRGGDEAGGHTVLPGDYGYEPNGVIHDSNDFPEESVLYFACHGPLHFIDNNDNTVMVLDWSRVVKIAEQARV